MTRGYFGEKGESQQISVLPIYRNSRGQEDGNSNIADTRRETLKKRQTKARRIPEDVSAGAMHIPVFTPYVN